MKKTNFLIYQKDIKPLLKRGAPCVMRYFAAALLLLLAASVLSLVPGDCTAVAGQVTLAWDKNSEPNVAGYKVYYGLSSGSYQYSVDVKNNTSCTIASLVEDSTYYFATTAYDTANNESAYSKELAYNIKLLDSDGDGISDRDEVNLYGTDPNEMDTDDDGIDDGEELFLWGDDWQTDFDQDGLHNLLDADSDNDGYLDLDDTVVDLPEPVDPDTGDGTSTDTFAYRQNFSAYSADGNPAGWLDTMAGNSLVEDDSLFKVIDLDGNKVFGTSSSLTIIHSHYLGTGIDTASGYEVTGRMMITSASGGIGVTFFSQYPRENAYYHLRRFHTNAFHIAPFGTQLAGDTETDVVPVAGLWYWFKVQVKDTGSRTEIRAKVWPENWAEPATWQVDCYDDTSTRMTAGTVGVWSYYSGSKYWDDLAVADLNPLP